MKTCIKLVNSGKSGKITAYQSKEVRKKDYTTAEKWVRISWAVYEDMLKNAEFVKETDKFYIGDNTHTVFRIDLKTEF